MQAHLTVVGFHGKHRASEVLSQLQQLAYDWTLDLKDAVAAYRTDDGRLRVDKSVQPTAKEGAGYGAVIAGVLGALIAAPFTGGLSVAAAATKIGVGALTAATVGGALAATVLVGAPELQETPRDQDHGQLAEDAWRGAGAIIATMSWRAIGRLR